jgi:hypothetical protein
MDSQVLWSTVKALDDSRDKLGRSLIASMNGMAVSNGRLSKLHSLPKFVTAFIVRADVVANPLVSIKIGKIEVSTSDL